MAPLKFEDSIKEKLAERAIEPSKDSWKRLADQLDAQQEKKKNSPMLWYAIAASIVGVLLISSIFLNKNKMSTFRTPQLVDVSKDIPREVLDTPIVADKEIEQMKDVVTPDGALKRENKIVEVSTKIESTIIKNVNKQKEMDVQEEVLDRNIESALLAGKDSLDATIDKKQQTRITGTLIPDDNVANAVAQIQELQQKNIEVTGEEIDQLLLEVQREITMQQIIKSNTVSASALLLDVETELDETFKKRVFEALKAGFQKVKTAVVEREN